LVATTVGTRPGERLVRAGHERTEGNPFFVTELLRLLQSEGKLQGGDAMTAARRAIPVGVREVLQRRLARLPEQTNAVLLVGAIAGRGFGLGLVGAWPGWTRGGPRRGGGGASGAAGGGGGRGGRAGRRGRGGSGAVSVRSRAGRRDDLREHQQGPPGAAACAGGRGVVGPPWARRSRACARARSALVGGGAGNGRRGGAAIRAGRSRPCHG